MRIFEDMTIDIRDTHAAKQDVAELIRTLRAQGWLTDKERKRIEEIEERWGL